MSLEKYRVHEIGKDFNVTSKRIMELLAPHFPSAKNHMTALSDEELSYVFEYFTQKTQQSTFEEYFRESTKKAAEKKAREDAEIAASQKASAEKASDGPRVLYVDTKTVDINLGKYDEKLEALVPEKVKDAGSEKQKLKKQTTVPGQGQQRPGQNQQRPGQNQQRFGQNGRFQGRGKPGQGGRFNNQGRFNRNQPPKKETEAEKLQRLQFERAKTLQLVVQIPEQIVVSELATRLKKTNADVVKQLMLLGVMASASQFVDFDTASLVAEELGAKVEKEVIVTIEEKLIDQSEDQEGDLALRDPVVVIMGHVDHGKTSLLDAIKHTKVTATEAGGITQHIGAYRVSLEDRKITFLDTPGHEAFTAMRLRGAQATDIAVLVVAADDGIMPQTIEAISHAKAAGVALIVAINKMDKPSANPERIKQQLTEHGLVVEDWGGETICVPVSAVTGEGIDQLLEMILLVADMKELKANPSRAAKGMVIEAKLDKGRGPVATVLVQNGTLNQGDVIIAGTATGRVRVMTDEKGRKLKAAGPSVPVEIIGLAEVPMAGDTFYAVADEKMARELAEQRKTEEKEKQFSSVTRVSLDDLFSQIQDGKIQDLNLIVKADVQGSVEAVKTSVEKLTSDEIRVRVIHGAAGAINSSDVMLASSANAIIIGFNVRPDSATIDEAARQDVQIKTYRVIYECIEEMEAAMLGMLAPKYKEVILGHAEIRQTFKVTGVGTVAGCYVLDGKITRNAGVRLLRQGIVICESHLDSLKRFKDDAKEVAAGYECGVMLEKFNDIKDGDIIEAFVMEEVKA